MKKIIALVLAAMMLLSVCSAFAADVPEGYPEIIEGLDFGGQTVYIYDWYSSGEREAEPDEEMQMTYDYRDWLEATYNCKLVEVKLTGWAEMITELTNMVMNKDNSKLCILGLAGDFIGPALANGLYMPWIYGLDGEDSIYNKAVSDFTTIKGVTYAVSADAFEPRQMVVFNKKVLEDANIDWNELYDLQASKEWTWAKMEEYMDKVQRDLDNDGVYDVYALTGNGDDVFIALVASNGADFFGFNDEGKLVPTCDNDAMYEAIQRRADWGSKYMEPNTNWDDYKAFWANGNVAFIVAQSYEAFNGNDIIQDCSDPWGAVAMPMGPKMSDYSQCASNNLFGIPNVYDEETSLKLQQIYTLYRMNTPGIDAEDAWITNKYSLTDDRAVDETYAMMRQVGNVMKYQLLGGRNDVITEIMWSIGSGTPAEIVEAAQGAFQGRCDVFNGDATQEEVDARLAEAAAEEVPAE